MIKAFLTSIFVLIFISCSEPEIKQKIVDENQLINILVDFHTIDAAAKQGVITNNRNNEIRHGQYNGILDKYNIERALFDSTITFYTRNTEEYIQLYEEVEKKLKQKLKQFHSEPDSLKKK